MRGEKEKTFGNEYKHSGLPSVLVPKLYLGTLFSAQALLGHRLWAVSPHLHPGNDPNTAHITPKFTMIPLARFMCPIFAPLFRHGRFPAKCPATLRFGGDTPTAASGTSADSLRHVRGTTAAQRRLRAGGLRLIEQQYRNVTARIEICPAIFSLTGTKRRFTRVLVGLKIRADITTP